MKLNATINILLEKKEGKSKRTGNPWQKQDIVLEVKNEGEAASHIYATTFSTRVIETLATCSEGDKVEAELWFDVDARTYNGNTYRTTNVVLRDIKVTEMSGF